MLPNHNFRGTPGLLCLVGLALALSGCSLLRFHHPPPKAQVASLALTTNNTNSVTLTVLQLQVMRFADSYVATVAQAADDFAAKAGTPKARLAALKWKLGQATSAYTDATGPNPVVNGLDMLVLVTMTRMVLEDYGIETFGEAAAPVLETQSRLETNAWLLANGMLKPAQQQELRDLIRNGGRRIPTSVTSAPSGFGNLPRRWAKCRPSQRPRPPAFSACCILTRWRDWTPPPLPSRKPANWENARCITPSACPNC